VPSPCDYGLSGVVFFLGDSVRLEPEVAPVALELGVVLAGVFFMAEGLGVFSMLREPLVPLGLEGIRCLGCCANGIRDRGLLRL
jgi:hypothetical protein